MPSNEFDLFAKLHPQSRKFDARVRLDQLYAQALSLIQASEIPRSVVYDLTELDLSRLPPDSVAEATCLAARVALQRCVDEGLLELNVFSPTSGLFMRLPRNALFPFYCFGAELGGQEISEYAWRIPETVWKTGMLGPHDGELAIQNLARAGLPVYVSRAHERVALSAIRSMLSAARNGNGPRFADDPNSDEKVDETIRGLIAEKEAIGELLGQEEATEIVVKKHKRPRDWVRGRFRALAGHHRPGPKGPRNKSAKNSAE